MPAEPIQGCSVAAATCAFPTDLGAPRRTPLTELGAHHRISATAARFTSAAMDLRTGKGERPREGGRPRHEFGHREATVDLGAARGRGRVREGGRVKAQVWFWKLMTPSC
jgi:hypothetical protein